MKLSVIIPTYNEGENIINCLESLGDQTYPDFEIIVIDDSSTDSTLTRLNNLKKIVSEFTLLNQDHKGPGAARNLGAKHAKGKVLVFVDADMTFDKNFLKEISDPIINGKSKGTFSKNEYVANWESVWARCWNINEGWEEKKRHPKDYPDKQKVFRAILKSEFDRVGGFTPGGYTDDYSLSDKLGYEAGAVRGAFFYHKNPDTLKEVYLQAKWAAKRKYKLGFIGFFIALVRTTFPFSLISGFVKAFIHKEPAFVVFKLVYDTGSHWGVIDYTIKGKGTK